MFVALAHKLFGTRNDRIIKSFQNTVSSVNSLEQEISKLSDEKLKKQTAKFKELLAQGKTLDDILPEAFATVREAAKRTLGQRHFDVQLIGSLSLHKGFISEMRTGEGKTLTATLAIYLNALEGKGVHVVTVNDYLASRDANWMRPIYEFLGLSLGIVLTNQKDDEKREAYKADITYGTNNEFGFDYLRDNMKFRIEDMVQRPFNYAIIDEVDSILIDEARTPLIITGVIEDSSEQYKIVNKVIPLLKEEDYEIDEKHKSVLLTDKGNENIEKILREMGILAEGSLYDAQNITIVHHVNQALRAHKMFHRDVDYIVKDNAVVIIDEFTGRMMEGRRFSEGLHQALEAKEDVHVQNESQILASITFQNYFRMYPKLAGMTGTALTEAEEFASIYNLDVVSIPTNQPMVRKDQDDEIYRTAEEKYEAIIELVKECHARKQPVLLGTTSIEKSELLSRMMKQHKMKHEVLNARYHEKEAYIIAQAGKPGAITIATNMAGRGTDIKLGGNAEMRIEEEISEKFDAQARAEAEKRIRSEIDAAAEEVKQAGGLYVIGSERHESRRIDNQLRGRSGRQGDPGASKFFISLEDDLMRIFGSERMDSFLQRMGIKKGQPIIHPWINTAIERAQKKVEGQHFEVRKNLLKFDNVMNDQRQVIYEQRKEVMATEDLSETIQEMRYETIENMVLRAVPKNSYPDEWDIEGLETEVARILASSMPIKEWAAEEGIDHEIMLKNIIGTIDSRLLEKHKHVPADIVRQLEKGLLLQLLDMAWKEHLLNLDYLRQGVVLRAFGQKDPLNEYRTEAFEMFEGMLDNLREKVTNAICLIELRSNEQTPQIPQPKAPKNTVLSHGDENIDDHMGGLKPYKIPEFDEKDPTTWHSISRNAPCPCGSGKKYKQCHGKEVFV